MTQEKFNEVAVEMLLEDRIKAKFDFIKKRGMYFIIDTENGDKKVAFNGKVFSCKTTGKLAETLFKLREGYAQSLLNN